MRKLALRQEGSSDLTTDDLRSVAAGGSGDCFPSLLPTDCCTGYYPSINAPCTTLLTTVATD